MHKQTLLKLAASTLVLGITMVGCKPAADGARPRSAAQYGTPSERDAGKSAAAALAAVQSQNWDEAVAQSEAAVALSPRDAGYRAMLGDVYLKAGRFDSAAAAYADSLQLNPGNGKAGLSLALTQIGLGRNADAIATLGAFTNVAPADHGLALALAGDKEGAIRLLSAAAREPEAPGRVRQNLALAYALAGDWTQARTIAAQDVPADELDARLAEWAAFAQPKDSYDQVATLLGVTPIADSGQPTRLALNALPVSPAQADGRVRVAMADPEYQAAEQAAPEAYADQEITPVTADQAPVAVAAAEAPSEFSQDPAPVAVAQGVTADDTPADPAPVFAAAASSIEAVLPRQMARPLARTIRAAASAPVAFRGRYVVQLGAFASAARVQKAWSGAVGRLDRLANFIPASTRFTAGGGSTLIRLSVGGFASRQTAANLCNSLKRAGGSCFVRETAGDSRVRWASRNARNG